MTEQLSRKNKYIPIILIEVYFIITILLFELGPINWNVTNKITLYMFLILFHISLVLGYVLGIRSKKTIKRRFYLDGSKYISKYISIALVIYIFITIMEIVRVANSFNPFQIISTIVKGIGNPGTQYYSKFNMNNNELIGGGMFTVLSTGLSFFYWPVIPVTLYKFKNLKIYQKSLTISLLVMRICTGFAIGTNKFVFDPLIILGTIIGLKLLRSNKKIFTKKSVTILIVIITVFVLGFSYFLHTITSRLNEIERYKQGYMGNSIDIEKLEKLPSFIQEGLLITELYLSQGYYGMSLALQLEFVPCYGLGNNNFVLSNIEEIFNIDIRERMYQTRIEQNFLWDSTVNWHTMYTWVANDVSFYGVIVVMFIIGFSFAKVWKSSLNDNIFAIALLPLYTIMFIFMSCNNQIFSLPASFMSFIFLMICWIMISTTRKENGNATTTNKGENNSEY